MKLSEAIKAKKTWNWFNYEFNLDDTEDPAILEAIKEVSDALDYLIVLKGGKPEDGIGL